MNDTLQDALCRLGYAVAVYEREETFFQQGDLRQPGCIVSPLDEADEQPWHLPRRLFEQPSPLKVVVLAERPAIRFVVKAMRNGAANVVEWPFGAFRLKQAIEAAWAASIQDQDRVVRCLAARQKLSRLTANEREIANWMLSETPAKNIAAHLAVSLRTVEGRRKAVFDKLETRSLAAIYATMLVANQLPPDRTPADRDSAITRHLPLPLQQAVVDGATAQPQSL